MSWSRCRAKSFNPRARAGRDFLVQRECRPGDHVSIHAPARGATPCARTAVPPMPGFNPRARAGRDTTNARSAAVTGSFNPRARAGRDLDPSWQYLETISFQSTRPRGARLGEPYHPRAKLLCFNPRARAGRDEPIVRHPAIAECVSIHAPARGATSRPHSRHT